jgi:hypothetical protein
MKTHPVSLLAVLAIASLTCAAEVKLLPHTDNLFDAVNRPVAEQDSFIREEAQKLAKSLVPTREDAERLALGAFLKSPGLDARETWSIAGLYRLGRDVARFAAAGDLVWELRVFRSGVGVWGVVWVSTTTRAVKVLFPVDP